MKWAIVAALSIAGCGRAHFEIHDDDDAAGGTDAGPPANVAFVTSTLQSPLTFRADLSGADAICNMRASEAGLPGTYIAWLSSSTIDARDRLPGARGWSRTDGKPFADRIEDLLASKIFYTLSRDEHGNEVTGVPVLTATDDTGQMLPNCTDFSNASQTIYFGIVGATAHGWTHESDAPCNQDGRLYCFGTSFSAPVSVVPASGRTAFLTKQDFIPDAGGLATADALCNSEASAAGLSGMYRALLATTTATAISRVSLAGATWVRTDGVPIVDSASALSSGKLTAPLNVTADGMYRIANAFSGATSITTLASSAADSCADWTNPNGTSLIGLPSYVGAYFFYYAPARPPRSAGLPLYCLEQ